MNDRSDNAREDTSPADSRPGHVTTPWTEPQITALNDYQRNGQFHPFTCGGERSDQKHKDYARANGDRDLGLLVATADGWRCPVCDYRQNWAHSFMATPNL